MASHIIYWYLLYIFRFSFHRFVTSAVSAVSVVSIDRLATSVVSSPLERNNGEKNVIFPVHMQSDWSAHIGSFLQPCHLSSKDMSDAQQTKWVKPTY